MPNRTTTCLLLDGRKGRAICFDGLRQVLQAQSIDQVLPVIGEVETLVETTGQYAVGFVSYEAAAAMDASYATKSNADLPLAWFALYEEKTERKPGDIFSGQPYSVGAWQTGITGDEYRDAIERIHEFIAAGDTYQVNFTYRMRSEFSGSAPGLFTSLSASQPVHYAALIDTPQFSICSVSPEMFFQLDGERLSSFPMKGTAPRGLILADDLMQAKKMRESEKERAENLMIVDMVRNDLGRIARSGTVQVEKLFAVERYKTVWQMVSKISCKTDAKVTDIFKALFPASSITGAPKVRTMEIIRELEQSPRGVYTGAIGWISPGRKAHFNVAIRTAMIDHRNRKIEYGTGGGIVWDSTTQGEFSETQHKAAVLFEPHEPFRLLETILWRERGGYYLLKEHLARVKNSARYFGFRWSATDIRHVLSKAEAAFDNSSVQKVRLLLAENGALEVMHSPIDPADKSKKVKVALAELRVRKEDRFLYHKTTFRKIYDRAKYERSDVDDVLLCNEDGELTESTIANIVIEKNGEWLTPAVQCGLLPGTERRRSLEKGKIREAVITVEDLQAADRIYLINSVRGWREAEFVE